MLWDNRGACPRLCTSCGLADPGIGVACSGYFALRSSSMYWSFVKISWQYTWPCCRRCMITTAWFSALSRNSLIWLSFSSMILCKQHICVFMVSIKSSLSSIVSWYVSEKAQILPMFIICVLPNCFSPSNRSNFASWCSSLSVMSAHLLDISLTFLHGVPIVVVVRSWGTKLPTSLSHEPLQSILIQTVMTEHKNNVKHTIHINHCKS